MADADLAFGVVDGWSDTMFVGSHCLALVSSGPYVFLALSGLYLAFLMCFQLDAVLFMQYFAVSGLKILRIQVFLG